MAFFSPLFELLNQFLLLYYVGGFIDLTKVGILMPPKGYKIPQRLSHGHLLVTLYHGVLHEG
jgi:hypothetical protein